ncbi:MAG TPA: protein-glutamate O-methyltransferase CheR [Candidatus Omnitrophota bacterium]|nr:protein-glutamate O-methyltransferase CheR [Candidatus Omnitrophota bacterium]HQJ15957.1 protein-glutamate O-methyltransferase CheR [Candidatus Omnitrophota bacterium]
MLFKTSPIIEAIIQESVTHSFAYRYDMCVCPACKSAVVRHAMAAVHSAKDAVDAENSEAATRQVRADNNFAINNAILHAIEHVSEHPPHAQTEDRSKTFKLLLQKILQERGLDFRNYHVNLLKRRFAIRIKANNLFSYTEYMKLLDRYPLEYDRLFETLCINVSEFFRDPPLWVTMQYLFERMISEKAARQDHTLTVWSAGCANGEEPYSLAISVSEAARAHAKTIHAKIIATDIDKGALVTAQKAQYPLESIKNVNDKLLSKYFIIVEKTGQTDTPQNGIYRVREAVTSMVSFSQLDLITGDFPKGIDLVLCRNVFIYFKRELQEQILRKFFEAIRPGGYLCLGQSESMLTEVRKLFEDTDSNARIYRRP